MIPVEEHAGLARDPHNKAVLNINKSEAERARGATIEGQGRQYVT